MREKYKFSLTKQTVSRWHKWKGAEIQEHITKRYTKKWCAEVMQNKEKKFSEELLDDVLSMINENPFIKRY